MKEGFFAAHGLEVELRAYDVGFRAVKGMGAGESDVATGTEYGFIANAFQRPDLRIIASITQGDTSFLVARRDRGINSVADLPGKRVAVEQGVLTGFLLSRFLSINRLEQRGVQIVNMERDPARGAVLAGTVDAAVLFEPDVQEARRALGPNAYIVNIQSGQYYYWVLASTESRIAENDEAIGRLLAAMLDAENFARENPDEARSDVMAGSRIPSETLEIIWPRYKFEVKLPQAMILAMEDEARWVVENGFFGALEAPEYLGYIYREGLESLKPEAVTIY